MMITYKPRITYKRAHDEEDDEDSTDICMGRNLSKPDGWHGNEQPIDALPVCETLSILIVSEWITIILTLKWTIIKSRFIR